MTYRVVWVPPAEDDLAEVWMDAVDRPAVARATDGIERKLGTDPLRTGKPRRSSIQRFAIEGPVGVDFEVIEDDKRVLVQAVWLAD